MLQSPSRETSLTIDQPVVAPEGVLQPAGSGAQFGGNASAARVNELASAQTHRRRTAASLTIGGNLLEVLRAATAPTVP